MPRRRDTTATRHGTVVRSKAWNGVRYGEAVVVNAPRERRQHWTFVAFAVNEATGEEWVEVRGGRSGESKGRSFRPELIFPLGSRKGSKIVGLSLASAPQLALE
ncbi:MAG: hypothetical protein JWM55_797 [Acidimicrobiaceae bacterium]|nr:hypothetical protein [Acidimicrobiaceae bacterium]